MSPEQDRRARFCPACGAALDDRPAFVQEYWEAERTNFFCWCRACGATATVSFGERVVASEPEH